MPAMQKRMIEAMQSIPGVVCGGAGGAVSTADHGWGSQPIVFTDRTTDLKPSNAAAEAFEYNISPEYLHAAGHRLAVGKDLHLA